MKFEIDNHLGMWCDNRCNPKMDDSRRNDFMISLLITGPRNKVPEGSLDCKCPKGQRAYSTWYPGTQPMPDAY